MLHKTTIDYLKKLKRNNNREWFESNRPSLEVAKKDFLQLTENMIRHLATIDPDYGLLKPANCIFRMNRDVRFSKDKSPYKSNMGAAFKLGGKKSGNAAFYIHIEPGKSFVGGGIWSPDPATLKLVRQEIDYHFDEFKKILAKKDFADAYKELNPEDSLKNIPKGYDAGHNAAHYLKLKSFVTGKSYSDNELTMKNLYRSIEKDFNILNPLILFLNRSIQD